MCPRPVHWLASAAAKATGPSPPPTRAMQPGKVEVEVCQRAGSPQSLQPVEHAHLTPPRRSRGTGPRPGQAPRAGRSRYTPAAGPWRGSIPRRNR